MTPSVEPSRQHQANLESAVKGVFALSSATTSLVCIVCGFIGGGVGFLLTRLASRLVAEEQSAWSERYAAAIRWVIVASSAVLFAATVLYAANWLQSCGLFVLWTLLLALVATDVYAMKVPNILSLPGYILLFISSVVCDLQSWEAALLGSLGCFLVMLCIAVVSGGRMGFGDVKLYLSIGAALGFLGGVESLVFASFWASMVGLVLRLLGVFKRRQNIPFVPFIALGVMTTVFFGAQIQDWYVRDVLQLHAHATTQTQTEFAAAGSGVSGCRTS